MRSSGINAKLINNKIITIEDSVSNFLMDLVHDSKASQVEFRNKKSLSCTLNTKKLKFDNIE